MLDFIKGLGYLFVTIFILLPITLVVVWIWVVIIEIVTLFNTKKGDEMFEDFKWALWISERESAE